VAFALHADICIMHVKAQSGRRWGIAILLAVLIHAVIALLLHPMQSKRQPHVQSEHVIFLRVVHRRIHKKKPIVRHIHHVVHHQIIYRHVVRIVWHATSQAKSGAKARNIGHTHRAAHGARLLTVRKELAVPTMMPALPTAAAPGIANVAGSGTVAGGAGAQGSGTGGEGGNAASGTGTGTSGAGSGDGVAPCGYPYIRRRGQIKTSGGLEHVSVSIQLELRNGSRSAEEMLPYQLVYHSDAESPFSDQNRNNPKFATVLLQTPPPGADQSFFSPMIQQVLAHTTPEGLTWFGPCPRGDDADGPP